MHEDDELPTSLSFSSVHVRARSASGLRRSAVLGIKAALLGSFFSRLTSKVSAEDFSGEPDSAGDLGEDVCRFLAMTLC